MFIGISATCAVLIFSSFGSQGNQSAWAVASPVPNGVITFESDREDGNHEIYIMNAADGSNPTRLTDNNAFDSSLDWVVHTSPSVATNVSNGNVSTAPVTPPLAQEGTTITHRILRDDAEEEQGPPGQAGHLLGWNPDGNNTSFNIQDSGVVHSSNLSSTIIVNLDRAGSTAVCNVGQTYPSGFTINCDQAPSENSWLYYVIVIMPAQSATPPAER